MRRYWMISLLRYLRRQQAGERIWWIMQPDGTWRIV